MTTLQIPDEIAHQFEDRAKAAGCDIDTFIREALLSKLEDLEDTEIAIARLLKQQTPIPIEQVIRNLGLED